VMNSLIYEPAALLLILFCFSIGCRKDIKNNPVSSSAPATQTAGGLEFILETTDMNGNFKSQFAQGENFKLTLIIKNNDANGVTLCHCFLTMTNSNLFAVYAAEPISIAKFGNFSTNDSIGKPWDGAGGIDIAPITGVGGNSFIKYSLPWFISDTTIKYFAPELPHIQAFHVIQNPMLPAGRYYTQFNFTYMGKSIHLRFYFKVY
ncbi:MAG: hypothetical protein ACRDE2_03275, partial [Chitinophagaceae bacterium]